MTFDEASVIIERGRALREESRRLMWRSRNLLARYEACIRCRRSLRNAIVLINTPDGRGHYECLEGML